MRENMEVGSIDSQDGGSLDRDRELDDDDEFDDQRGIEAEQY